MNWVMVQKDLLEEIVFALKPEGQEWTVQRKASLREQPAEEGKDVECLRSKHTFLPRVSLYINQTRLHSAPMDLLLVILICSRLTYYPYAVLCSVPQPSAFGAVLHSTGLPLSRNILHPESLPLNAERIPNSHDNPKLPPTPTFQNTLQGAVLSPM